MLFAYNMFTHLFSLGMHLASPFHAKARKWVKGRASWRKELEEKLSGKRDKLIWIHSASLGEFEQGRTLIEAIKKTSPEIKILVSFFSPSGYEVRKNFHGADYVCYLPMDNQRNAVDFIEMVQPSLVVFIKYELWFHYLNTLNKRNIPTMLISAIVLPSQAYFGILGGFFQSMLKMFTHIFVQDASSKGLLSSIGIEKNVSISGDTRFDRVAELTRESFSNQAIEHFCGNEKVLIAGSTWREDESALRYVQSRIPELKLIIAPHEIHAAHLAFIQTIFTDSVLLSEYNHDAAAKVLIIDSIGMLSKIYRYATIAYVGGGFNKAGIHNILEAAAYGKFVCWGPHYQRSAEAKHMLELSCGFSYHQKEALADKIAELLENNAELEAKNQRAKEFVSSNQGATSRIMVFLQDSNMV